MSAVFDRRFAGGAMPVSAAPGGHARLRSIPAGLAVATVLSVGLHLASMLPIRIGPGSVAVQTSGQPLLTRMIYVEPVSAPHESSATADAPPAPAPAVAAEPPAMPTPLRSEDSVRATPRPAESRRSAPIVQAAAQEAQHTETQKAEAVPAPTALKPALAEPAPPSSTLPPAPAYAQAATLNPPPRPLGDIEPEYPKAAGLRQGVVVLRLLIDEAGHVDNVAVVRSSPKGLFEDSALAAFGKAAFSPGMLLGVAVKSQWTVEVEFTPVNRGASVAGRDY